MFCRPYARQREQVLQPQPQPPPTVPMHPPSQCFPLPVRPSCHLHCTSRTYCVCFRCPRRAGWVASHVTMLLWSFRSTRNCTVLRMLHTLPFSCLLLRPGKYTHTHTHKIFVWVNPTECLQTSLSSKSWGDLPCWWGFFLFVFLILKLYTITTQPLCTGRISAHNITPTSLQHELKILFFTVSQKYGVSPISCFGN